MDIGNISPKQGGEGQLVIYCKNPIKNIRALELDTLPNFCYSNSTLHNKNGRIMLKRTIPSKKIYRPHMKIYRNVNCMVLTSQPQTRQINTKYNFPRGE